MTVTLYDQAYPNPSTAPHVSGALAYIGGDTPHIWTDAELAAAWGRYRLPTYVRSNPQNASAIADANAAVAWLKAHHVPTGKAVCLDLETAVNAVYVLAFGNVLHQAGYLVWPYGSKSTLFQNPKLDGYFVADYTQTEHQYPGAIATQWADPGAYDVEDTDAIGALWDLQAAPTAPPKPVIQEEDVVLYRQSDSTQPNFGYVVAIDGAYRFHVATPTDETNLLAAGAKVIDVTYAQFEIIQSAVVPTPPVTVTGTAAAETFPKTASITFA